MKNQNLAVAFSTTADQNGKIFESLQDACRNFSDCSIYTCDTNTPRNTRSILSQMAREIKDLPKKKIFVVHSLSDLNDKNLSSLLLQAIQSGRTQLIIVKEGLNSNRPCDFKRIERCLFSFISISHQMVNYDV